MPSADAEPDYSIDPPNMRAGIEHYLDPIVAKLWTVGSHYSAAHEDVRTAQDSQQAGWFPGGPFGAVELACGRFFAEATGHLEQLSKEQAELVTSLEDYRKALVDHVDWAERNEREIAARFQQIERELDERGNEIESR